MVKISTVLPLVMLAVFQAGSVYFHKRLSMVQASHNHTHPAHTLSSGLLPHVLRSHHTPISTAAPLLPPLSPCSSWQLAACVTGGGGHMRSVLITPFSLHHIVPSSPPPCVGPCYAGGGQVSVRAGLDPTSIHFHILRPLLPRSVRHCLSLSLTPPPPLPPPLLTRSSLAASVGTALSLFHWKPFWLEV
jgi:hypothetical protein